MVEESGGPDHFKTASNGPSSVGLACIPITLTVYVHSGLITCIRHILAHYITWAFISVAIPRLFTGSLTLFSTILCRYFSTCTTLCPSITCHCAGRPRTPVFPYTINYRTTGTYLYNYYIACAFKVYNNYYVYTIQPKDYSTQYNYSHIIRSYVACGVQPQPQSIGIFILNDVLFL